MKKTQCKCLLENAEMVLRGSFDARSLKDKEVIGLRGKNVIPVLLGKCEVSSLLGCMTKKE